MRIGVLSDVHGNFTALQAVLADLQREAIDLYLILGDLVLMGPQPAECLERLRALSPAVFILGNTDHRIYEPPDESEVENDKDRLIMSLIYWAQSKLTAEQVDFIRGFERTHELDLTSGRLLAYHGAPNHIAGVIRADTPEQELERLFAGYDASYGIGGHTHLPMLRSWGQRTLINPGSVGAPFRLDEQHFRPHRAEYGVLTDEDGRLDISLRRVPVDVEAMRRAARVSGMPDAQGWSAAWGQP